MRFRAYYCWFGRRNFFENEIWWLWCNLKFFGTTLFTNSVFWRSLQFFTHKYTYLIHTVWKIKNIFCRHFRAYYCGFGWRNFFENEIWWVCCNLNLFGGHFSQIVYFGEIINFTYISRCIFRTVWTKESRFCRQFSSQYWSFG